MGAPDAVGRPAGVWTLAGNELIIAAPGGPATILVPTESVLLLAVDLPLSSRAKRLEALPFAIEDRVAESLDRVHLAVGAEIAPKRYLVGVVRHELMARWVELADAAGLGHAAMVPDALALPVPEDGGWSVDLGAGRAVVRASDATGFAMPASMLRAAWGAAGEPAAIGYGEPLPIEMAARAATDPESLARRLASPALDLRQGIYARRRAAAMPSVGRKLAWIVGLGALAHASIAVADTAMLHVIANRRAAETRQLVATAAPGRPIGDDLAGSVASMLPSGPAAKGGGAFVPLLSRVSAALVPLGTAVKMRAISFQADRLTLDLEATAPDLAARVSAALRDSGIEARAAESPDRSIRITASAS